MKSINIPQEKLPFCIKEVKEDSKHEVSFDNYLAIFWNERIAINLSFAESQIAQVLNDIILK